jgi:hypothetical protein
MLLLGLFSVGSIILLLARWRSLPRSSADEAFSSREFWLVIGSLVLLISAVQISFSTSIPVLNKLIGPDGLVPILGEAMAPPTDVFRHYHSIQIPVYGHGSLLALGFHAQCLTQANSALPAGFFGSWRTRRLGFEV